MPENKMQIRTKVINLLSKYRSEREVSSEDIKKDIETLKNIESNDYVVKLLLNEIKDKNRLYNNICALFLMQVAIQDNLEKNSLEVLNDKKISDTKKFFIISILKQRGVGIALDDIDNYITSDEELLNNQIGDFIDNAFNNPEVQIDLLDFFENVIEEERLCLIKSLIEETSNDKLAALLSLIAHCELNKNEAQLISKTLIDTKSLYSTYGLEFLIKSDIKNNFFNELETKKIIQTIKKNKLKDKDFCDTSLIKNSKIDKCLISLVDGKSMFSLVFSRIYKNNTRSCTLLTIDITKGITSVIGFANLSLEEFMKILKRVFNKSLPVEINPIALKSILDFYYEKNFKTNTLLPYELAVWMKYLADIRTINYDLSEFLNSKLEFVNLSDSKVKKIINSKFFENWFYIYSENKDIDEIINFIEKQEKFNLDEIENHIQKILNDKFMSDNEYIKKIHSDILIQSYVINLSRFKAVANTAYSICFNRKYLSDFVNSIIDKSILQHYINEKENKTSSCNMFKKGEKTTLSAKNINKIINHFGEKWK